MNYNVYDDYDGYDDKWDDEEDYKRGTSHRAPKMRTKPVKRESHKDNRRKSRAFKQKQQNSEVMGGD